LGHVGLTTEGTRHRGFAHASLAGDFMDGGSFDLHAQAFNRIREIDESNWPRRMRTFSDIVLIPTSCPHGAHLSTFFCVRGLGFQGQVQWPLAYKQQDRQNVRPTRKQWESPWGFKRKTGVAS